MVLSEEWGDLSGFSSRFDSSEYKVSQVYIFANTKDSRSSSFGLVSLLKKIFDKFSRASLV
jgi:hypothetical protein